MGETNRVSTPRFHLFHSWGRWYIIQGTVTLTGILYGAQQGKTIPVDLQVRDCQLCGKRQQEKLYE